MNYKLVLLCATVFLSPLITRGVRFVPLSIEYLTSKANVIIQGTVRERIVERDSQGNINTKVQIAVAETWKGAPATEFTVVQAGGTLGERAEQVDGQEPLEPGEEVVLFLLFNARRQGVVIGSAQGKFKIRHDRKSGDKTVHNLFHGKDPKAPFKLSDLKAKVKGRQP